jgi:hypothetical protein
MSDTTTNEDSLPMAWEARRQLEEDRRFDLAERQIAAQERLAEAASAPQHTIVGDSPTDRLAAFFVLPREQQDFRLREMAVGLAVRLGGSWEDIRANADLITEYVRGDIA